MIANKTIMGMTANRKEYENERAELETKFRVDYIITEEEAGRLPYYKAGTKLKAHPLPTNQQEAWYLLVNYFGPYHAALCKEIYCTTHGEWDETEIEDEIKELEKFIKEANNTDAEKSSQNLYPEQDKFIYKKMFSGAYKSLNPDVFPLLHIWSPQARIYGKYILYYEFLKNKKAELTTNEPVNEREQIIEKHLKYFKGKINNKDTIINADDYKILLKYTLELIEKEKCPSIKRPFISKLPTPITNGFIRYTFCRLHDDVYGTVKKNKEWAKFIHKVFKQFPREETSVETTFTKFRDFGKNTKDPELKSRAYQDFLNKITGY